MNERLGYTFKDKITGFIGVATGHVEYISGCHQTLLSPRTTDPAKMNDTQWFDDQRLEQDIVMPRVVLDNGATPGHDCEAPKR